MKATEYLEIIKDLDEYKEVFDALINTYGKDLENYLGRMMMSVAGLQRAYYNQLINEGFTELQAFTLLLDIRNAIKSIDLASRSK
jgi:hypothetical protein